MIELNTKIEEKFVRLRLRHRKKKTKKGEPEEDELDFCLKRNPITERSEQMRMQRWGM